MNKEFILLDDGNMLVTDENGNMDKRYYGNGAQSELLSENKKELIENKLKEAKDKLISDKKAKKFSKDIIEFMVNNKYIVKDGNKYCLNKETK